MLSDDTFFNPSSPAFMHTTRVCPGNMTRRLKSLFLKRANSKFYQCSWDCAKRPSVRVHAAGKSLSGNDFRVVTSTNIVGTFKCGIGMQIDSNFHSKV